MGGVGWVGSGVWGGWDVITFLEVVMCKCLGGWDVITFLEVVMCKCIMWVELLVCPNGFLQHFFATNCSFQLSIFQQSTHARDLAWGLRPLYRENHVD